MKTKEMTIHMFRIRPTPPFLSSSSDLSLNLPSKKRIGEKVIKQNTQIFQITKLVFLNLCELRLYIRRHTTTLLYLSLTEEKFSSLSSLTVLYLSPSLSLPPNSLLHFVSKVSSLTLYLYHSLYSRVCKLCSV